MSEIITLTEEDRAQLVDYVIARKMPKVIIRAYADGTNDGTPLAQLVASTRVRAASVAAQTADESGESVQKLKSHLAYALGKMDRYRNGLMTINGTATSFLVRSKKIRDLVTEALMYSE